MNADTDGALTPGTTRSKRSTTEAATVPVTGAGSVPGRLAVPAGLLAAVAGAFAYVGTVDPGRPGHYPPCPLYRWTGIYCPGCGGLRCAHAFVHGDLAGAFQDNAVAVLGFFAAAVLWTVWVVRAVRGRPPGMDIGRGQLWLLGTLVALFTVVRNLPSGGWLHP